MEKTETELSAYGKFHCALSGFDVYLNGEKISKWEAFAAGITNANLILKNKTVYNLLPKENVHAEI